VSFFDYKQERRRMDFAFVFSSSDEERDEAAIEPYERDYLERALRRVAREATDLSEILRDGSRYEYTLATAPEAIALSAAIDVIEREDGEDARVIGSLRNLRYRLRGRRF
jgi:hypothetical protein